MAVRGLVKRAVSFLLAVCIIALPAAAERTQEPKSIQTCRIAFDRVGSIPAQEDGIEDCLLVWDGERLLRQGVDYRLEERSWVRGKGGDTIGEVCQNVSGMGSYTGSAAFCLRPVRDAALLKDVSRTASGNRLSWQQETGALGYLIYRDVDGKGFTLAETVKDNAVTAWTDPYSAGYGVYSYYIRSYTSDGSRRVESAPSDTLCVSAAAAPVVKSVVNVSGGMKVTWGRTAGGERYRVFCKTGTGGWNRVGDTAKTELTVQTWDGKNPFRPGSQYTFTVRCISKDGCAYTGGFDKAGKTAFYWLPTPRLSGAANVAGGVKVTWEKTAGAQKYRLYYKTKTGGWKKLADTASLSYTWKQPVHATEYRFTLRTLSGDGKTLTSSCDSEGAARLYLKVPVLTAVGNNKAKTMNVTWGRLTGVEGYQLRYSTDKSFQSGCKTVTVQGAAAGGKSVSGLAAGKTYYVSIRTFATASGVKYNSAWSAPLSVRISR